MAVSVGPLGGPEVASLFEASRAHTAHAIRALGSRVFFDHDAAAAGDVLLAARFEALPEDDRDAFAESLKDLSRSCADAMESELPSYVLAIVSEGETSIMFVIGGGVLSIRPVAQDQFYVASDRATAVHEVIQSFLDEQVVVIVQRFFGGQRDILVYGSESMGRLDSTGWNDLGRTTSEEFARAL